MKQPCRTGITRASWACMALLWLMYTGSAMAQDLPVGQRSVEGSPLPSSTDSLVVTGTGPFLIRPFLVESSLQIRTRAGVQPRESFLLDPRLGFITFPGVGPDSSFVFVASYQYVPLDLSSEYRLWESERDSDAPASRPTTSRPAPLTRLTSRGSITRGVMSGTGRDASIESGLRLEVEGAITDSVSVRAVLTDEDTPLLPEGTTSRLDQFDQVFIEFSSSRGRVALGDVDVALTGGDFAKVRRRVQGVNVESAPLKYASNWISESSFQAIGASSRGKYRSQFIQILEGVQGPYRLEGTTSERFILVLPGTERVYIDGVLLERGLTSDYIIDYTTAELTFTPTRIVGADSRVRVEFEYTTNQYSRSFLGGEASVGVGKRAGKALFNLGVSAIRESDGDSFSEELGFSSQDSLLVSQAGDDLVFTTSAIEVSYDAEALFTQYFKVTSGGMDIFEAVTRAPLPGESVYRVSFTRVGLGNGSYKRTGSQAGDATANGIVFSYVGAGRGEYDAVRPLTPPGRKELLDVRFATQSDAFVWVEGEWATSRYDRNTMSSLDFSDDTGHATSARIGARPLSLGSLRLSGNAQYNRRSAYFTTFDRSREVEFERDWNLGLSASDPTRNLLDGESEQSVLASVLLQRSDSSRVEIGMDVLSLGSILDASRQRLDAQWAQSGLPMLTVRGKRVRTQDDRVEQERTWHTLLARLSKQRVSAFLQPYVEWEQERFSGLQEATLFSDRQVDYDEFRVGSKFGPASNMFSLSVEQRTEQSEIQGGSGRSIQTLQGSWLYEVRSVFRSDLSLGLRRLDNRPGDSGLGLPEGSVQNALLIGYNGEWNPDSQHRLSWFYQVQSEQSARMQEIYIRTGQERGQYVWQDLNGDNVIQLDEFIPETTPGEGEYALTYFPSDSLESVTSLNASARFTRQGGGSGNRLSRIGISSVVEVSEKTRDEDRSSVYLLRLGTFRTSGKTVNGRIRVHQDLHFLPTNTKYDLDLSFSEVRGLSDLSSGEQRMQVREWSTFLSYRPAEKWILSSRAALKTDISKASFASRTFDIQGVELNPELGFKPRKEISLSLGANLASRTERNQGTDVRAAFIPFTAQYQGPGKWTVRGRAEVASIRLDGPSRGLQTYELTDGRGPGNSWLWGLSMNARVSEVVTASFSYDGRAPSAGKVIHTGRIQFMARF